MKNVPDIIQGLHYLPKLWI